MEEGNIFCKLPIDDDWKRRWRGKQEQGYEEGCKRFLMPPNYRWKNSGQKENRVRVQFHQEVLIVN